LRARSVAHFSGGWVFPRAVLKDADRILRSRRQAGGRRATGKIAGLKDYGAAESDVRSRCPD